VPTGDRLEALLKEIAAMVRPYQGRGAVAGYIPELARIPRDRFAISVATTEGDGASAGDFDEPFSLQSITKVFALILALNLGGDEIWERVGKEPSGTPFNFLAQLEAEGGVPRNPFINAGALTVTDYLITRLKRAAGGRGPAEAVRDMLRLASQADDVVIDEAVALSELRHAHKNRAIANILYLHGAIRNEPEEVLAAYCRQCAIQMSLKALTRAFLPLADGGFARNAAESITTARHARRVNALMTICGLYDAVGSFAYRVGLPAKSGVGGGLVAVAPGICAVGAWGPELDRWGNSHLGTLALEQFVSMTGLSSV
jgi:glutaminase